MQVLQIQMSAQLPIGNMQVFALGILCFMSLGLDVSASHYSGRRNLSTPTNYEDRERLIENLNEILAKTSSITINGKGKSPSFIDQGTEETLSLQELRDGGDFRPIGNILESLETPVFKDCEDAYSKGRRKSGVYRVCGRDGSTVENALCDMDAVGQGWRVIQQRKDGSVDFEREWYEYKRGFGDLSTEFWLGLDPIHNLTKNKDHMLRIEITTRAGPGGFAQYDQFWISDESKKFVLHVSGYSGFRAGDGLSIMENGMMFSTKDRKNDQSTIYNCAVLHRSGWWHNECYKANLNGRYDSNAWSGIKYFPWDDNQWVFLTKTKMMVRRKT